MREVSENNGPAASRLLDELMASSLSLAKRSWRVTATVQLGNSPRFVTIPAIFSSGFLLGHETVRITLTGGIFTP
jgi:hypothetical protein